MHLHWNDYEYSAAYVYQVDYGILEVQSVKVQSPPDNQL